MACDVTLDDLPQFDEVAPAVKALIIVMATGLVLGPAECQAKTQAAWTCLCLDPCLAIKLLAAHILAVDPDVGLASGDVVAEKMGDVSATYANVSAAGGMWGNSTWGRMYASLMSQFRAKSSTRSTLPIGVGGFAGC